MEPGWDDDEPLSRRRNPVTVVVAVLLVLALVAGGVIIAFDRTDDGRDRPRVDDVGVIPPVVEGPPPTEDELEAAVAEISDFVAAARELEFERPVTVALLDDEAFSARVQKDAIDDLAELDETERVLRALGLLNDDVDLAGTLLSFLGAGVVGFYDPETGELVLRGASLTPYVRITLAHELTHALDDQHFDLDRSVLDEADDERGFAFGALVEGNASRVEEEFRESLTDEEREQAGAEEARLVEGIDFGSIPRVVPEMIGFPYIFGPALVDALVNAGGNAAVDEAYRDPPVTSEQVLDPGAWLADAAEPVTVPPPEAAGEVFDEGVLGLWGIVLLLQEELGQQDAVEAARGWGGDWYVAWRDGDRTCVRATFVMDTAEDLGQLETGLEQWALEQGDAQLDDAEGSATLTSCR